MNYKMVDMVEPQIDQSSLRVQYLNIGNPKQFIYIHINTSVSIIIL